jgi:hypothetical protein
VGSPAYRFRRRDASPEAIAASVVRQGLCVVEDWLDPEALSRLRAELDLALSDEAEPTADSPYNPGRLVRLKRAEIGHRLPATAAEFGRAEFEEVSVRCIRGPHDLNDEIFVSDHGPDEREILPLHYDRLWCLKFFLYLRDTEVADGAFEAVPGSHHAVRRRRQHLLSRGVPAEKLPNRTDPVGIEGALPVTAPAGALIVFDTDTLHKGGTVRAGGRRLVMRGHTHPRPADVYRPVRGSRQWLREWRWNPLTAARRLRDRVAAVDHALRLA